MVSGLTVQVGKVDPSAAVGDAGDGDNARVRPTKLVQQQARQREMTEVVDPELQLEPVFRVAQRRAHDPGIVDKNIELAHTAGSITHAGKV